MRKRLIITREENNALHCAKNGNSIVRRHALLEKYYHEELGFDWTCALRAGKIIAAEPLPKDTEVIFISGSIHHYNWPEVLSFLEPNKKAKIIYEVTGDRRMWHGCNGIDYATKENYRPFLKRVSVILDNQVHSHKYAPEETTFALCWPEFAHKHVFMPFNFCPDEDYLSLEQLPLQETIPRCLFSGRVGGEYELRNFILDKLVGDEELQGMVDIIRHPKVMKYSKQEIMKRFVLSSYAGVKEINAKSHEHKVYSDLFAVPCVNRRWGDDQGLVLRENFSRILNKYFAGICVNGGRKVQIVMQKYFEIPAAGALLLSEGWYDLFLAGFVPGKHYVPIEASYLIDDKEKWYVESDAVEVIKDVIMRPQLYDDIRKQGTEFVRKHHSLKARCEQFRNIFERMMAGESDFRDYPKLAHLGEK